MKLGKQLLTFVFNFNFMRSMRLEHVCLVSEIIGLIIYNS